MRQCVSSPTMVSPLILSTKCTAQNMLSSRSSFVSCYLQHVTRGLKGRPLLPIVGSCHLSALLSTSTTARSDGKARRIALSLAGGAVVTSLGGLVYLSNHVGGSEGLLRTANFYSLAIPKYIEYRMHMMMNSPDEVWCVILAKFGSS